MTLGVLLGLLVAGVSRSAQQSQTPQTSASVDSARNLISTYCMGCHSDTGKAGGLALSELKLEAVGQHAEIAEKVIRKLRAGMMPPPGSKRPDGPAVTEMVAWLEKEIDTAATDSRPGRVGMRRLNRR